MENLTDTNSYPTPSPSPSYLSSLPSAVELSKIHRNININTIRELCQRNAMDRDDCNSCFRFLTAYVIVLAICILYSLNQHEQFLISQNKEASLSVPTVNKTNATKAVAARSEFVHKDFEQALVSANWTLLRSGKNITIERATCQEGWPDYLKTTAHIPIAPEKLAKVFGWNNFHSNQLKIDPFYEGSNSLASLSKTARIIRKTTKRPLFYPKREFTMAMLEGKQKINLKYKQNDYMNSSLQCDKNIPRGTLWSALNTVSFVDTTSSIPPDVTYVKAYQDFIAWFVSDGKGTELELFIFW